MKKVFVLLCAILAVLLVSCGYSEDDLVSAEKALARSEGYTDGYNEGYDEGYYDGLDYAPELVEEKMLANLHTLNQQIKAEYCIVPEDAIRIIANYADGEPIEEDELICAMWAVWEYYIELEDIIYGISTYDLG